MLTVMFPTGVRVTYNEANYLVRDGNSWDLYTAKDGNWVASIQFSAGVLIEAQKPCVISAPPVATVQSALELVVRDLNRNQITGRDEMTLLRDVKQMLRRLDARKKVRK